MAAVLFDFSGTLFRIESGESWLRAVLTQAELALPEPELLRAAQDLESVGALPGGAFAIRPVPDELAPSGRTATRAPNCTGPRTPASPAKYRCPTPRCTTRCTTGT